jgi:hypothetical protein
MYRGLWLSGDKGKFGSAFFCAPDVDSRNVGRTVVGIPGFNGGPRGRKDTADFEFSLRRDEGGVLENV